MQATVIPTFSTFSLIIQCFKGVGQICPPLIKSGVWPHPNKIGLKSPRGPLAVQGILQNIQVNTNVGTNVINRHQQIVTSSHAHMYVKVELILALVLLSHFLSDSF